MNKEKKAIILSIILWIPFAIWYSRLGHHNHLLGEYSFAFLDMLQGICSYLSCLWLAYWFVEDKKEE